MLDQSAHLEFELGQQYNYPGPPMDELVKDDLKNRVNKNLKKKSSKLWKRESKEIGGGAWKDNIC